MTTRSNSPYVPSFIKAAFRDAKPVQLTYSDFSLNDSNASGDTSYKYDPLDFPLKSTQQLNVDWSKFENHCFFSSAEVKVNEAFNKLINGFPFDGSKKEVETFLDSLTGFEKWVHDSFPRWAGALHFSGTQTGEDPSSGFSEGLGTWISVKDKSGALFPDIAKNNRGLPVINPGDDDSLTLEALIRIPDQANNTQVVFQKNSSPVDGFSFHIEPSVSTTSADCVFSVSSGSVRNNVSATLKKGQFNHICLVLNKQDTRENSLQFYVNEKLVAESKTSVRFKKLNGDQTDFLVGSGSSFYSKNTLVTPQQTFSGSMDELRVFHEVRDASKQIIYSTRGLYSTPGLKLYFRFNEPSGSLTLNGSNSIESIVLDSSGNSLHSNISNYSPSLRLNMSGSSENILIDEADVFKTVLFPAYPAVIDLNRSLLNTASIYDGNNPNNILRLIPQHYLIEGASQDGFTSIEGQGGDPYGGEGIPGQGQKGSVQIILSFLYIWAKFFDELKTYIDSFITLKTVHYDSDPYDTIPDNFLEDLVRNNGFYLPKFFNHATIDQFAEGQNLPGLSDLGTPLKKIQAILTRRALTSMNDVIRSKGTQHSIKSFLRSIGIDPENSLKIREYGGPTVRQITTSRDKRFEPAAMVDFVTSSIIISPPLSGSRVEPGAPEPAGNFLIDPTTSRNTGTSAASDGLFTSGSWHLEGVFKFPPQKTSKIIDTLGNQSLLRLIVTGSATGADPGLVANVIATQFVDHPETTATLQAFIRPGDSASSPLLTLNMNLKGMGIFDGDRWNVSIGCLRNDEIGSRVSSSYYLRAAKSDSGDLIETYTTASFFQECPSGENNVFRQVSSTRNASGSYVCLGNNQTFNYGIGFLGYRFLNQTPTAGSETRTTDFEGWASNLRFWSKGMSENEWLEHARNPKSVGVSDPKVNYNFVKNVSGSFQKIRLDTLQKQAVSERYADSGGSIKFRDFSLNTVETIGTGFGAGTKVLIGDLFSYSHISPAFDEAATDDKVRIRSFESLELLNENPNAVPAPSYLSEASFLQEEPQDDLRLSIEFSMMDSLDRDIVSMFSSLDVFNDYIGRPELMFSPDYPDLEVLRDVYFNRLSSKPDFRKFLEFYRWFDTSVSSFIEQLIPSKTAFKGTNFVVESHMLERHKNIYRHSVNYLGQKQVIEDSLLVQQIVGKFKKY